MIGRYAQAGVYRELFRRRDFYLTGGAGLMALASYLIEYSAQMSSPAGLILDTLTATVAEFKRLDIGSLAILSGDLEKYTRLVAGAVGVDVALETADTALTRDDIARLPFLIRLSRRMLTIIKANIIFGLGFNALAILASGYGYLSPIEAAATHNFGSVLVVMASSSLAFYPDRSARAEATDPSPA